ncbi:hypothetical protein IFM89_020072 [Coptis chinensis]|uniref:S phase cyclin A-associated protein in the endoplasmic reticulum N-terminal domain-containing protein n=1 Tax=Coptis chinensis TaxID=261450 RepID=A0A835LFR9_9MAGN|nr:hypothetical protein IFM89_020072 [Coptis chinensis]
MDVNSDDQNSGWSEVKKKHRKFSIHGLVGGFSNKVPSSLGHNPSAVRDKSTNSKSKQKSHAFKAGQNFETHVEPGNENSKDILDEEDVEVQCLDKCIVSEDSELPSLLSAKCKSITSTNDKIETVQVATQKENLDRIPKIKWGDLEDDALMLCGANMDGTEIKFGDLGVDNSLTCRKTGNADELVSFCPPDSQDDKKVVTLADTENPSTGMFPLVQRGESYMENCKVINELGSKETDLLDGGEKVLGVYESYFKCHLNVKAVVGDTRGGLNSSNPDSVDSLSLPIEEAGAMMISHGQNNKPEDGSVAIPGVPDEDKVSSLAEGVQASLPPVQEGVPESSDDILLSSFKDWKESQDGIINVDNVNTEIMDALEEGGSSESKERFRQRLWCFLFENLNRAVDELYLLCELECDLEQMKEAFLVLEEAGSDFKELKSRVEGFEIGERYSSQQLEGLPVNMKTDHRRTHALSWEVRRMTASPHRAEILSSSLEAFKKIQKERTSIRKGHGAKALESSSAGHNRSSDLQGKLAGRSDVIGNVKESVTNSRKQNGVSDLGRGLGKGEKKNLEGRRFSKAYLVQHGQLPPQNSSTPDPNASQISLTDGPAGSVAAKCKREHHGLASEIEKQALKKDRLITDNKTDRNPKYMDPLKRQTSLPEKEKEKEKRDSASWRSLDAWKEKRNWEDILASPLRMSSRVSNSPGISRRSMERTRVLHDKLMSPEKKKKTALDMKKEAEEKHARATRIRSELENERLQRLQRTSEKLNRVNEWQAVRTSKMKEGMHARHQRSESRHEAYLAQVARRAGDETSKVNEVRFITSLNDENKKHILRQKLHDSELRRAEKLQVIKTKQKEDIAREEAVLERRRLLQAEKLQRLAEIQRKKEEAQVRREEERKASSAAREARAIEQLRRKEVRAKAQQEEAELLAQKLAERLSESEQRRKFYLEQIRERASMDFRDQSSPLVRRSLNKDSLARSTSTSNVEDCQATNISGLGGSSLGIGDTALQHSLKRRIKKIRQRLMALKHEPTEPPIIAENAGAGYRSLVGTARAKIGRWLQELQRLRQARKEGASSIGLIVGDMIKFLEGKEPELHASRQAGLLDFIASALPASHTSKPEACQVTIYLLRLLRVVLSMPANQSYFLAHNLLPPLIPMLSAALESYIKIAASLNISESTNSELSKTSVENFEAVSEILEGFIWAVTTVVGHLSSDERQAQMRDFLLELVIAYQVIHRLRELFALHDRPQVEGSPFPLPIILSLNMLVVLTSRPGAVSSIDCVSFPSKLLYENQEMEHIESVDLGDSSLNFTDGDHKSLLSGLSDSRDLPLSDVPEDRPLGESRQDLSFSGRDPDKERTDASDELNHHVSSLQIHITNAAGKPQKDLKISTDIAGGQKNDNNQTVKQPVTFLLSVIAETGLVSLPSLLTAVLLQANSRLSSEQGSYVLPSNFEEVATGVLKVLNNLALLDIALMQSMLARPDLKMEFFHLMSFLLSHCTSKWKGTTDQVGLLLFESLLLLGYFALFHPGNQAVLRWGKSPTILHKVCDLPFVFFSDTELMPILAGTLVSACYGCEQNKGVVQQELSTEMLLSLVGSCRSGSLATIAPADNTMTSDLCEGSQLSNEPRKFQVEVPVRSGRCIPKSTRLSLVKGGASGSNARVTKVRNQRDVKVTCATKTSEQWLLKHNLPAAEASSTFMLHSRFPVSFVDRAEEFFSAGVSHISEES